MTTKTATTERPLGKIVVKKNHPTHDIKRGTIACPTIDDLVTEFENLLDAGLAVDKDFTIHVLPGIPGTIARVQAAYRRKTGTA